MSRRRTFGPGLFNLWGGGDKDGRIARHLPASGVLHVHPAIRALWEQQRRVTRALIGAQKYQNTGRLEVPGKLEVPEYWSKRACSTLILMLLGAAWQAAGQLNIRMHAQQTGRQAAHKRWEKSPLSLMQHAQHLQLVGAASCCATLYKTCGPHPEMRCIHAGSEV